MTTEAAQAVPTVSPAPSGVDLDSQIGSISSTRTHRRTPRLAAGAVFLLTLVCHLPLLGTARKVRFTVYKKDGRAAIKASALR